MATLVQEIQYSIFCSCDKQQNIEYYLIVYKPFDTANTTYHHIVSLPPFEVKIDLKKIGQLESHCYCTSLNNPNQHILMWNVNI